MLHKGLCRLFQWVQDGPPCVGQDTHHSKRKQLDSREKPSGLAQIPFPNDKVVFVNIPSPSTTCLIPSISKPSYFIPMNTKTCTYKKDNKPRSLYVYSSLCNPVMVGDQTTVLLRQVPYRPLLTGTYSYDAPINQYVKLRNPHIEEIETEISETDTNQLFQFSQGAMILTVHFRKAERHVQ